MGLPCQIYNGLLGATSISKIGLTMLNIFVGELIGGELTWNEELKGSAREEKIEVNTLTTLWEN